MFYHFLISKGHVSMAMIFPAQINKEETSSHPLVLFHINVRVVRKVVLFFSGPTQCDTLSCIHTPLILNQLPSPPSLEIAYRSSNPANGHYVTSHTFTSTNHSSPHVHLSFAHIYSHYRFPVTHLSVIMFLLSINSPKSHLVMVPFQC